MSAGCRCGFGPGYGLHVMVPVTNCPTETTGPVNGGQNVTYAQGVRPGYAAQTPTTTLYQRDGDIERASLNLSAQWQPTTDVQVFSELFYTRKRQEAPTDVDVLLQYVCLMPQKTVFMRAPISSRSLYLLLLNLTSTGGFPLKGEFHAVGDRWHLGRQ